MGIPSVLIISYMALNTELLLTLKQISGLGNKTILSIAQTIDADTIQDLCKQWIFRGNKRLENIIPDDLMEANRIAKRIIDVSQEQGIGIVSFFEDQFPDTLRECINEKGTLSPPLVLFYRGNINAMQLPGVAVIGTREPTPNGIKAGHYFACEFARKGFNIVSGLAVGCDTAGHEGALMGNGVTTAFLATSLDWNSIYPKQNLELAKRIVEHNGLLLSEYYIGQTLSKFAFVERDRLQAGLSSGTIVVQTGETGGTMHAVNATLKAGKPLMMVKYNLEEDYNNEKTAGNNLFINQRRAHILNSQNLNTCIELVRTCSLNKPNNKQSYTLFD